MINCTFENGNKASLRHVVVDTIVVNGGQILLVKRARHLSNGGKWAIVGGFVDRDETCEQAARRELKEEAGLDAKSAKFIKVNDNPRRKNEDRQNIAMIYEIEAEGEPKRQESEVEEVRWFPQNALPKEDDFAFDHWQIIREYLSERQNS